MVVNVELEYKIKIFFHICTYLDFSFSKLLIGSVLLSSLHAILFVLFCLSQFPYKTLWHEWILISQTVQSRGYILYSII